MSNQQQKIPKKAGQNNSPRTTLHASVYQDQINLGDRVHLAKKPAPRLVMLVPRDQQGRWGRKEVQEGCQVAVQGQSFDLRQMGGKKKIL